MINIPKRTFKFEYVKLKMYGSSKKCKTLSTEMCYYVFKL